MADTMRRRMNQQDELADDHLEPAGDAYRRMDFRRRVRAAWRDLRVGRSPPTDLAADLGIPGPLVQHLLRNRFFGAAWGEIEFRSPFLLRRRMRFIDLPGRSLVRGNCSGSTTTGARRSHARICFQI
jgi:hypothetical protein